MTIDLDSLMKFLSVAIAIGSIVFTYLSKKDGATAHQIREIEQKQQAVDARLVQVETRMQNVPGQESIHRLELKMQEVNGKFDQVNNRFETLSDQFTTAMRSITRLEEFLFNNVANAANEPKRPARAQGRK